MKSSSFSYYIREGVTNIFTHGFMSFASVCIIVACLIIMGSFSLLAANVNSIISQFEDQNVVLAFIDDSLSEDQAKALQSQIQALSNVSSANFISRNDAMNSFVSKYQDKSLFQDLDSSVLRDRYAVYMKDISQIEQTRQSLLSIKGIVSVNANLDIAQGFIKVRNIVSGVSMVLVVVLLIISLFIMSNTIKLATFDRREEIAIMKMVGATNSFIRWPFVFEGFILGVSGSLISFVAQWGLYTLVTNKILGKYSASFISAIPFSRVSVPMFIVFLLMGFGVGVGGSLMAIRNYLKV